MTTIVFDRILLVSGHDLWTAKLNTRTLVKKAQQGTWEKSTFQRILANLQRKLGKQDYFMNLRVDKEMFLLITEKLAPYIHRQLTRLGPSIPDNERVAIGLWRYGTGDSSQTISGNVCSWRVHMCRSMSWSSFGVLDSWRA